MSYPLTYKSPSGVEVRGTLDALDEVVADGAHFHLEVMSDHHVWMKIGTVRLSVIIAPGRKKALIVTAVDEGQPTGGHYDREKERSATEVLKSSGVIPLPLAPPADRFLCKGTGFKLQFNKAGNCTSMANYAKELDGRWVALVPAEDGMHMKPAEAKAVRLPQRHAIADGEIEDGDAVIYPDPKGEILYYEEMIAALKEQGITVIE